jgi:hypothetical protein
MTNKKLFSATLFFTPGDKRARKYRNISNVQNFIVFASKINCWYINWYDQKSGKFENRQYFK